jgi:RNA polymerase sigma factor (sigma-70 family)
MTDSPPATRSLGGFLARLRLAFARESLAAESDAALLERVRSQRDEAALIAIVKRHGPMIHSVCRRMLRQESDIDDCFQATLLVLVRQAPTIRNGGSLASWLHGVAFRLALKVRNESFRARRQDREVDQLPCPRSDSANQVQASLDEELNALSEVDRVPLILCYLENRTQDEAAALLGWSKSTLRRRLERGKERLERRLARRGVTASIAAVATVGRESATAGTWTSAARAALAWSAQSPGAISTTAASLAAGAISTMTTSKSLIVSQIAVALAATGLVAGSAAMVAMRPTTDGSLTVAVSDPPAPAKPPYATKKALEQRTIGFQSFNLLPSVKVWAKLDARLDMIFATGNPRSFLPRSIVKKIGAPIVDRVDITNEQDTRASLGLSGANTKDATKFDVARIHGWDLGVGPPGQKLEVLVIEADEPGFGVVGRDWMQACREGENGIIADSWHVYFGRMVDDGGASGPRIVLAGQTPPGDDVADVPSQDIKINGDDKQRYFLIGPREKSEAPKDGRGLVIIMPGGDGSADFHPFVKRIFKNALPGDFIVAQPVAVKWTPDQKIVWPTETKRIVFPPETNKADEMKFSTEKFIDAVIADVSAKHKIDPNRIYTLSWSSSGPAAYAISLTNNKVKGSFIAMSVFNAHSLPSLNGAKGHMYFLYHSPDDRVCPIRLVKDAEKSLTEKGAKVKFQEYAGGHGWRGGLYDHIRGGFEWLEKSEGGR